MDDSIFATMMDDLHVLQLDEVQRCRYFELLGLAVRCRAGGVLRTQGGPLDLDLLSSRLKISYDELVGTLVVLTNVGLVDYQGDAWIVPAGAQVAAEPPVAAGDMRQYWRERKQQSRSNRRQATGQPVDAGEAPRLQDVKMEASCGAGDNGRVKDMSMTVENLMGTTALKSRSNGGRETKLANISSFREHMSSEYEDVSAESEDTSAGDEDSVWESEQASEDSQAMLSDYETLSPALEFMFQKIIEMSANYFTASDKPAVQTIATFVQELFPELFTAITTLHSALVASETCPEADTPYNILENVLDNVLDRLPGGTSGNVFDMSLDVSRDTSKDMSSDKSAEMSMTGQENAQKRVIKLNKNIKLENLNVFMTQNLPPNFVAADSPAESLPAPGFERSDFVGADSPAESLPAPGFERSDFVAAASPAESLPAPGFKTSDFVAPNLDAPQAAIGGPAALGGSPGPPGLPRPEPEPVCPQNSPARPPGLLCAADASSEKPDIVEYLRQNFPDVDINAWQAGGLRRMCEHYEKARLLEIIRWAAENGISAATLLKDLPQLLHRIEIRAGPVLTLA